MDLKDLYNSIVIYVENRDDVIETKNLITRLEPSSKTIAANHVNTFPNYLIYYFNENVVYYLSNSRYDDLEYILDKHVINNSRFKGYPVRFKVNENDFKKIKNIFKEGTDIIKPSYKPRQIVRESLNYKYNGWVVFKIHNDEEKEKLINNLDIERDKSYVKDYPVFLVYNFDDKTLVNFTYKNDEDVLEFINNLNDDYLNDKRSDKYVIPHIFNINHINDLKRIRMGVFTDRPSYKPRVIKKYEDF